MRWTGRTLEFILDHGLQVDEAGIIQIPAGKWSDLQYTAASIENSNIRTLLVPSDFGSSLLFENKHFVVVQAKEEKQI